MNLQSNTPAQQTIVVMIEDVDITNRLVHAFDKSKSRIDISFRDVPGGGILRIPTQGERWVATRTGWIWRLIARLDSSEEHDELVATLQPGDARLDIDGSLFIQATDITMNGYRIGPTVNDSFFQTTPYTSVSLAEVPITAQSVMPFMNGLLVSPDQWTLTGNTLLFNTDIGMGSLVVYYQAFVSNGALGGGNVDEGTVAGVAVIWATESDPTIYTDAATVIGVAVISGQESRVYADTGTVIGVGQPSGVETSSDFPSTPIIDTLQRTEAPMSDSGRWTQPANPTDASTINLTTSGASTGGVGYGSARRNDATFTDSEVYVTAVAPGTEFSLYMQVTSAGYGYLIDFTGTTAGIYSLNGWGTTLLTSFSSGGLVAGDQVGARKVGSLITVYKNHVAIGNVSDSTHTDPGYLGFDISGDAEVDQFGGGAYGTGGTATHTGVATIRDGGSYDTTQVSGDYDKMDIMVIDIADPYSTIAAALPNTRVLFYRSAVSCHTSYDSCIPHSTASANGWFLSDSGSNLLVNSQFSSPNDPCNILDTSNPAVSTAVGNAFVQWCQTNGFAGIWCDDVVSFCTEICNALPNGWTQATWYSNMVGHVRRIAQIMRSAGLEFISNASGYVPGDPNSDNAVNETNFWTDLVAATSGNQSAPTGFTVEYWEQNPNNIAQVRETGTGGTYPFWDEWRALHTFCQNHGVVFFPLTYASADDPVCIYARATFLLDYDGGASALDSGTESVDAFGPTWCKNMGIAQGAAVNNSGVWTRSFANGTVTVDSVNGTATIT